MSFTKQMVDAHNARVAKKERASTTLDGAPYHSRHNPGPDFVPKKSTDEEKLNKTERAYLHHLRRLGHNVGIQNITLKLADDCRFTADFNYFDENGRWRFVDVKGFQREDALIKIKVAAREYPHLDFVIVKKDKLNWVETPVKP
jgi:hypothetical protein